MYRCNELRYREPCPGLLAGLSPFDEEPCEGSHSVALARPDREREENLADALLVPQHGIEVADNTVELLVLVQAGFHAVVGVENGGVVFTEHLPDLLEG